MGLSSSKETVKSNTTVNATPSKNTTLNTSESVSNESVSNETTPTISEPTISEPTISEPTISEPLKPDARDYGKFYFISFIATIYCRMSYLNSHEFLNVYKSIFGGDKDEKPAPIIPNQIMIDIATGIQKTNDLNDILNDDANFNLTSETRDKYGIPIIIEPETPTGKTEVIKDEKIKYNLPFLNFANKINILLGEEKKGTDNNCHLNKHPIPQNESLVFVAIDCSVYGTVFVFADKRFPSIVNVIFRGTSNLNDSLTYMRPSSVVPITVPCPEIAGKIKVIYGIYNALSNIINAIMCSIDSVVSQCNSNLQDLPAGSIRIVTSGHSLGGALCSYFAFKYIFFPEYRKERSYLDKNICCVALASPVAFDDFGGAIFCCVIAKNAELIEANKDIIKTDPTLKFIQDKIDAIKNYDTIGRIVFLNVLISNDPVASLPLGYTRPGEWKELVKFKSSEIKKEKGGSSFFGKKPTPYKSKYLPLLEFIGEEEDIEQCLVEVKSPFTGRCLFDSGTIVHTSDLVNNPPKCIDMLRAFTLFPSKMGPVFINLVVYHTEYLGISFAKAFTFIEFGHLSREITYTEKNGKEKIFKKKSALARLIFYPAIKKDGYDYNKANIIFYPLNAVREIAEDDEVRENKEEELAKEAEKLEDELKIELGSTQGTSSTDTSTDTSTDASADAGTERINKLIPDLDETEITILEEEETGEEPRVESPKKQKEIDVIWKKMKDLTQSAIDLVSKFPIDEDLSMKPLFFDIVPFIKSVNAKQKSGNSLLIAMNDVVTYDILNKIAPVKDHSPELTEQQEEDLEKEEEDKAIEEKEDIEAAAEEAISLMDTAANNSELVDNMISKHIPLEKPFQNAIEESTQNAIEESTQIATGGSIHKKTYKKTHKKKNKKTIKKMKKKNKKVTIKKQLKNKKKKVTIRKKMRATKTLRD